MPEPSLLIVLPTYDERENVCQLIPAIHEVLASAHLLIVDDASPDGTGREVERVFGDDERVHVMHRPGKLGLGTAYLDGFRWALARDYELVMEMDADFSHHPRYLPDFVRAAEQWDLVLGSRYMRGGGTAAWSIHRNVLSRGGNLYARAVLGLEFMDTTGGFKCFRRKVLETIELDAVGARGFAFQIELTWRALQHGFRVCEIPITFEGRRTGESSMSLAIIAEALVRVWRLRQR
jgi:dolichol-phosphate mannosyltransferase